MYSSTDNRCGLCVLCRISSDSASSRECLRHQRRRKNCPGGLPSSEKRSVSENKSRLSLIYAQLVDVDGSFWDFTSDLAKGDTAYTTLALGAHTDTTYFVSLFQTPLAFRSDTPADRSLWPAAVPPPRTYRRYWRGDSARRRLLRRLHPEGAAPGGVRAPVHSSRPDARRGRARGIVHSKHTRYPSAEA